MASTTYAYTARDAGGKVVKGRIEANSQSAVLSKLRTMGISPISVEESANATGLQRELKIPGLGPKVGLKDLAVMNRQMATMIGAGLSLIRTLGILADQTENPELSRLLNVVKQDVEQGTSLSDALLKHPMAFPPLMIHMIRAGEAGGFLDEALVGTANNFESEAKLRDTIKSALTYPVIVLVMALVAVVGMLIFIVPIFDKMFADFDAELPAPTQFLVLLSNNMIWIAPLIIVSIVVTSIWWRQNKNTDSVRARFDTTLIKLPVFGPLFKKIAIARFSRTFATMLGAGVPILQSLGIVGETSGNWAVEQALKKVQESVRQGKSISGPLSAESVFPSMVVQMIAVGEDSGSMETMLQKISEFYDAEVEATTKALTSLIEPLMIAFLGVVIGGMIVALYLPIFTIYNEIG